MDTVAALSSANESALKLISSFQQSLLEAHKTIASSLSSLSSDLATPSWVPGPAPDTTRDVVAESFSFREKLVSADKDFALGVLEIWAPEKSTKKK